MADLPECFVLCPIGDVDSDVRRASDKLLEHIIEPAIGGRFRLRRADQIQEPGRITAQIASMIGAAPLVIADLTGANANVLYEIGLRHALGTPIIHMCRSDSGRLPFDVADTRTIFYDFDVKLARDAAVQLRDQTEAVLQGKFEPLVYTVASRIDSDPQKTERTILLAVHDAVSSLTRESIEHRRILDDLRVALAALKEARQQEVMAGIVGPLLGQAIQNPDGLTKLIELSQKLGTK